MFRSLLGRSLVYAALLLATGRAASANLISNGDFEGGTYTQTLGSVNNTLPDSWTNAPPTAQSNLNVFANGTGPGSAESGTHYMAFQSPQATVDGTQDCLNQVISTTAGEKYLVSFYVAMTASSGSQFGLSPEWNAGGGPGDVTMGSSTDFYFHPTNAMAEPYTHFTFIETATGTSTSVYFHGADATGAVLLDNVSITPLNSVPEPSSLCLASAALVSLLAIGGRRRG